MTNITGAPGGGGTIITIRGYNSLDVEQKSRQFSNPLWVVDGVPLNSFTSPITGTNLLAEINPDMIESVQVLKDASAASIYGSRCRKRRDYRDNEKRTSESKGYFFSKCFPNVERVTQVTDADGRTG